MTTNSQTSHIRAGRMQPQDQNGIAALYATPAGRYGVDDENSAFDFWKILNILQKWWWLIGLIILTTVGATYLSLKNTIPQYSATATLNVKQQTRNIVDGSNRSGIERIIANQTFLLTQIELLKSEKLAVDVIVSLNLINDDNFIARDQAASMTREQKLRFATNVFKNKLSVEPVGRSRIIDVNFIHTNPNKAALIANSVTETFINNSLESQVNSTRFAREFLEDRLVTVRQSLEDAERGLVEYASNNNIIRLQSDDDSGASGDLATSSLVTLDEKLTLAQLDRIQAESAYKSSLTSNFLSDTLESAVLTNLKKERTALNSNYLEDLKRFKPEYPDMLELKSRIELFDREIIQETEMIVQGQRDELRHVFELAKVTEADLEKRVQNLKNSVVSTREKSIDYNILKRQVDTERTQYEALLQRLKEVSVSDDVGSNLVEIVDPASIPRHPFSPKRLRALLLALMTSTAVAFGLTFAIEIIDNKVRTPMDVKNKLSLSTMGVIPKDKNPDDILKTVQDSQSSLAEGYASLKANLKYSTSNGGPRSIQFTSTKSGEGKSVSSLGLAVRYANDDIKTLLIDADMRRPTFNHMSGDALGLSGVLTENVDFKTGVSGTAIPNLSLMKSGRRVTNPSGLLSSNRFDELLAWAKENYDFVIVDGPPVLGLADATILGAKVAATLLVVEAEKLRTPRITSSIERLNISGTNVIGVVLTKYNDARKGYGYGYYDYKYGESGRSGLNKIGKSAKEKQKFSL